jgi:pyridoxine 5-phosphate synthase
MIQLSVNVNKIATLRNARGGNLPNVQQVALDCVRFGAHGITVHPRPDERHIRKEDVIQLKSILPCELNVEGYPSEEFMQLVIACKPAQVTLVPDPPNAITSSAGWDTHVHKYFLKEIIQRLKDAGIRTSIFVDASLPMIEGAAKIHTDRIELYTEAYASNYERNAEEAIAPYILSANAANGLGLQLNAGHDLNLQNLQYFAEHIPGLYEVSIGHALICDALYLGLENTLKSYLNCLQIS